MTEKQLTDLKELLLKLDGFTTTPLTGGEGEAISESEKRSLKQVLEVVIRLGAD